MCLCLSSLRPTVRPHLIPYRSRRTRPRRSLTAGAARLRTAAYGQPAPTANSYGQAAPTYGQPAPDANTYGQSAPAYGTPAPDGNPYGPVPPSYGQYAAPTATVPLDKPYYGCSFQEAFLRFWKKYTVFRGRASRSEFWWWVLAAFGINIVLDILNTATDEKLGFLATIWGLATLIPTCTFRPPSA